MQPQVGSFGTGELDFVNFLLVNGVLKNESFSYKTPETDEKPVSYTRAESQKSNYVTSMTKVPEYNTTTGTSIDNFITEESGNFDDPFEYKINQTSNQMPKDLKSIDAKLPDTAIKKTYNIAFKLDDNSSDTSYNAYEKLDLNNSNTTLTTLKDKLKRSQYLTGEAKVLDPNELKIAELIEAINLTDSNLYLKSSKENEVNGYEAKMISSAQFENKKNKEAEKKTYFTTPLKELNKYNSIMGSDNGIQFAYNYSDNKKEELPQPINVKKLTAVPVGNCGVIQYK